MDRHYPRSVTLPPDHSCDAPELHMNYVHQLRDRDAIPDLVLMLVQLLAGQPDPDR